MTSDPITDRRKSVAEVLSVIRTQSEEVAASLDLFFAPDVREGESPPAFAELQIFVGRALERLLGDLIEADDELFVARSEAGGLRDRFQHIFAGYRRKVVALRKGIRQFYPGAGARALSAGDTPRAPEEVFALGGHIVTWIDRPDLEDHTHFAVKDKRDQMAEERIAGQELLRRFTVATTAHQVARQRRKDSFKAFNQGFVHLAGMLENLYGLSGHPGWARLVRPSGQDKGLLMSVMKRRRAARVAAQSRPRREDESAEQSGDGGHQ